MAEQRINLNSYKASGVYTIEIDESENVSLPITSGRLIIGSSRIGPFNTVVLINDLRTLKAVYGEIDSKLEKKGGYFHRSIETALREGPVFALNVLPIDDAAGSGNLDQVYFTTFNTESSSGDNGAAIQNRIVDFFNKRRLWFASDEFLNKTKNTVLSGAAANKILSFVNTGKSNSTVWTRRAATTGFDITASEWYNTIGGGKSIDFPNFVHKDDFISDYMIEAMIVKGDWTNHLRLAKDPIYGQFFDETGLIESKSADFFALREIKVINRTIGCLIPNFVDQSGNSLSIDLLINRLFPTTGILAALDVDKLDDIDLEEDNFVDTSIATHRVDLVGHGFDDLGETIDNGGVDTDGATVVAASKLIETLSYSRPADKELVYKIEAANDIAESAFVDPDVAKDKIYLIDPTSGEDYIIATENSKLYDAFKKGFIKTGDTIIDASNSYYIRIEDNLSIVSASVTIPYIKILVYTDNQLSTGINVNTYTDGTDKYFKIITLTGENFKNEFDLTDTSYFETVAVTQPNILTVTMDDTNTAQKAIIDDFIKVNSLIKASTDGTVRDRYLRIISVVFSIPAVGKSQYVITTMAPLDSTVIGIDITGNKLNVIKGIANFSTSIKGQYLKGFKVRDGLLPNSTATRQSDILKYLFDYTSIPQALAGKELIDFRYVVDTYEGEISSSSKYYLSKIAALHGQSMAILNSPSIEQFEKSVNPSFINQTNKLVSAELISKGGDLSLNPEFTFKFAEEDINGIPLSSYSFFNFPNLIIRNGNRNMSVPPAAYISNLYVKKFKNGTPFLIVAGGKRGVINSPELNGVEYELTDEDRAFLEPIGHNLIIRRRGFGTLLFSNNTAYQRINSALNNAHVRDNLSTIERDIARILFNFLFDFNDEITRLRVKSIVSNYLDSVVNASGLSSYSVVFDSSNNTTEVISANTAIIDILVDFPRGIHKFINRITITRVGGQLSSESTGFTPSF
tara:strand:+ start:21279 stop:24188 length:2910 start_codon:yes stop_codon:yes gene_type:complete